MGTLLKKELKERYDLSFYLKKSLVITPLLSRDQIGESSIDLRLSNEFIIVKRRVFPSLNLDVSELELKINMRKYFERVRVDYNSDFILHPQQLILGSTLEFLRIPYDTNCTVIGKSTWGRMGLVVATAINVDPGFRGCITLELINLGEVPIILKPGLLIAQIVLQTSEECGEPYLGQYSSSTGPKSPEFKRPKDWNFWYEKGGDYFITDDEGNGL